ncbi:hypothetical protein EJ357_33820 [Streptomyces cyaneochromogenes]|uniref:Uncharacterized protein n=1 Tax=Streptomyces cyaneochromogenes TaxID=2496836 RepID=A0A3Q9EXW5_9ACTN|nr:hypothetical protein [Streptomyces cyaneochromogenes]AZQ37825.1 hypothetical protein EJ357_33820 [Streptomyces cyaneochromogenes]
MPSADERENAAYGLRHIIKVSGENPVLVGRGLPNEFAPDDLRAGFTLYEDLAGLKPLCSVAPRATEAGSDGILVVLAPDGAELGVLRPPARTQRWRRSYEMGLPDGTRLVGRSGTVTSWGVYVVLCPLLAIYNVLGFLGGYGGPDWFLPTRTVWRTKDSLELGRAALKFYGTTDKYKVRVKRLDPRLAYAQAVLHDSSG